MRSVITSRASATLATRSRASSIFPEAHLAPCRSSGDVVGTLETLFQHARKQFVDEIFFTTPCERGIVQDVLEKARMHGVDLRVVPDMYDGLAWNSPIEYIGQFPTIPLHCGHVPELGLLLKRTLDIVFSSLLLLTISPFLIVIAIAIKLGFKRPGLLHLGAHRQKGPRLPLHQVPHHGAAMPKSAAPK